MEEWKEYKLIDVCENIYSGGTPSSMIASYWNGNLPWLSSGETNQRYIYYTEKSITKEGADNSSTRYAFEGSTVIASAGQGHTRGQASMLCIDTYVNQSVLVLKPNPLIINPHFLYFNLDSRYNELRQLSDGCSTRGSLSGKILKDLKIYLPSLNEQLKIVSILKSLDDKIEVNRRINDNLEQQAQALFKSWFVDFEPFQDGEFQDSELGRIPKGWSINKLKEVCHNITDGVHNTVKDDINGSYYLLSAKNIKGGLLEISKNDRKINKETFEKLRRRTKLEKGDILLTSVGTIGELFILKSAPTYYEFQRSVAIIKPNKEIVCSSYIYESLKARLNDVKNLAHGAVQQCIFIGDLKDFKLIIAPNCLIQKYKGIVEPLFEEMERINCETLRLAELRDTLLPKLMSGEIEV